MSSCMVDSAAATADLPPRKALIADDVSVSYQRIPHVPLHIRMDGASRFWRTRDQRLGTQYAASRRGCSMAHIHPLTACRSIGSY